MDAFIASFDIMIIVAIAIVVVNLTLTAKDMALMNKKKQVDKKVKYGVIYDRVSMTVKIFILVLILLIAKEKLSVSTNVRYIARAEEIVSTMYVNNPEDISKSLKKFENDFTKKGFVAIDADNNSYNLINRYTKLSSRENKVYILDGAGSRECVYIRYQIEDKNGMSNERMAIFTRDRKRKFADFKDYELLEENKTTEKDK